MRAALGDLLERIRHTYDAEVTEALVSVTRNSVNVSILDPTENPILRLEIQFVMRLFGSVEELLLFFDFGACRFAYTGSHFLCTASALYAAANGAYFLEPAMLTYPKRIIKYDKRGFKPLVPKTVGFGACMMAVMTASDESELVRMTHLKSLISLLAFTRLAILKNYGGGAHRINLVSSVRTTDTNENDASFSGVSGDVHKPLLKMRGACFHRDLDSRTFVRQMAEERETVWEIYKNGVRTPADEFFAEESQVEKVLIGRMDLWKLDKPCVNLVRADQKVDFFRTS